MPEIGLLDCVPAALANAVRLMVGVDVAVIVRNQWMKKRTKCRNFRGTQWFLRDLKLKLDLKSHAFKTKMSEDSRKFAVEVIEKLPENMRGVWLVRLVAKRGVHKRSDHCIVVDRIKGLIISIAEDKLIMLTAESFRLCGTDERPSSEVEVEVAQAMEMRVV